MYTPATATIIKMVESLPEDKQEKVVEHLREYIADLEDKIKWDILFKETQSEFSEIAKSVRKEISEGKTEDFNYKKL